MRPLIYTAMLILTLISSACGALDVAPAEVPDEVADLWAGNTDGWPDDIAGLTKELYKARLAQIAILIADESQGESGLLLKDGVSADPKVKYRWREDKWGDIPAISVYQASVPVNMQFEGIDPGRLIGAVSLLVEAASPNDSTKTAQPGVYMLYMADSLVEDRAGSRDLWLISIEVGDKPGTEDEGKVTFKKALVVPGLIQTIVTKRAPKKANEVTVSFTKAEDVNADRPAGRVSSCLRWDKQSFSLYLDLAIRPLKEAQTKPKE